MQPAHLTRPGSSLLLAILIVAITLGTASTLATISIQALKRTSTSGDAAVLLYTAESELERQLYLARKQKNVPSGTGGCNWPGAAASCTWDSKAAAVQQYTSTTNPPAPKRDQAVQFMLLGDTSTLKTDCTDADTGNGIPPWAEVTRLLVSADSGATWKVTEDGGASYKQYAQCGSGTPDLTTVLTPGSRYVVRIKALYDNFSSLQVRAEDARGVTVGISGMQTLKVTAKGSLAQQVVKATFPAAPAAVGFVDYVLFSECSIKKGVGGAACS